MDKEIKEKARQTGTGYENEYDRNKEDKYCGKEEDEESVVD